MRTYSASFAVIGIIVLTIPPVAEAADRGKVVSRGEDGSVCYERDVKEDTAKLKNMEKMVEAGKFKAAFDAASGPSPGCMPEGGYDRIFNIIERTYKPLGQQAEKAGRLYEAHKYYIYPFEHYFMNGSYRDREKNYSFADADRTMLAYAKANSNEYKVIEEAVRYFDQSLPGRKNNLKAVKELAMRGGEKVLAKEEKDFSARKFDNAFKQLEEAGRWFEMGGDERPLNARAKQRVNSLLAESSYDAIERAFNYTNVRLLGTTYTKDYDAARARAGKLGDAAEKKSDLELARKFYYLSDDEAKKKSVDNRLNAIQAQKDKQEAEREQRNEQARIQREKAEPKRQEKFKKEQESLEKELGL